MRKNIKTMTDYLSYALGLIKPMQNSTTPSQDVFVDNTKAKKSVDQKRGPNFWDALAMFG